MCDAIQSVRRLSRNRVCPAGEVCNVERDLRAGVFATLREIGAGESARPNFPVHLMSTDSRGVKAFPLVGAAVAGFALAVMVGILAVRFAGFDVLCKRQILCTVTKDAGWASQVHLTWQDDTASGFVVSWRTASAANERTVEYRPAGAQTWTRVRGRSLALPPNGLIKARGFIHRAKVSGLAPASSYEYRVSNDKNASEPMSAVFRTRTAPAGAAPVSLYYIADTGLKGRVDGLTNGTEILQRFLLRSDATFILGGGDYAAANTDGRFAFPRAAIDEWFRQWQPIISQVPFLPQYGNHEIFLREGFTHWRARFGHPNGFDGGKAYSFDVGAAHVTAMFAPGDRFLPSDDLLDWLDRDLAAARRNGASWLIVYQHGSLFGDGKNHPPDPRLRQVLSPVLERHNVDLLLSGEDQNYERTFPLRDSASTPVAASRSLNSYAAGQGVIYVNVGPAGKRSERSAGFSKLPQATSPEIAARSDDGFHFARLDVSEEKLDIIVYKFRPGETEPMVFERVSINQPTAVGPNAAAPK